MKTLQFTSLRTISLFLPKLLAPVLVILLAYQASQLTWLLAAPGTGSAPPGIPLPPPSPAATAPVSDHAQAIAERHLFGAPPGGRGPGLGAGPGDPAQP